MKYSFWKLIDLNKTLFLINLYKYYNIIIKWYLRKFLICKIHKIIFSYSYNNLINRYIKNNNKISLYDIKNINLKDLLKTNTIYVDITSLNRFKQFFSYEFI
jgi:hypothetical protein